MKLYFCVTFHLSCIIFYLLFFVTSFADFSPGPLLGLIVNNMMEKVANNLTQKFIYYSGVSSFSNDANCRKKIQLIFYLQIHVKF